MDRICWSKKGQAMVQIFLETSGNALNSNSESIRLLKKLLNWKNSFTGSSKKINEDISFFKNKNALSQNYLDKTKWIAPSFFCWSQSLKKSSSSVAPNYKRGNFVKSASCQFRSRQNVSADSEIVFSPVSFSGFSSQPSPSIKGFVWLLIPSPPPSPICPRIWSEPLGKRTKDKVGMMGPGRKSSQTGATKMSAEVAAPKMEPDIAR